VPYYGSYASFVRVLTALRERGIPNRITARSLSPIMGVEGPRISTHFASMGWIDADDKPTDELIRLVYAFGDDSWKTTLTEVVRRFYGFVPQPWAELRSGDLHEAFLSYTGREAKVLVSAETFFLALALECGIELSERLYFRAARAHSEMAKRAKVDVHDETAVDIVAKTMVPKEVNDTAELKQLGLISANLDRISVILALSLLLGDTSLTDQERKAVGITISVMGRTNTA
jgi:hypothetical protein